jgi:membrane-associated protein
VNGVYDRSPPKLLLLVTKIVPHFTSFEWHEGDNIPGSGADRGRDTRMVNEIIGTLLGLSGPVVYAIVAPVVFFEAAIFIGFFCPGKTTIIVAGALAGQGKVPLIPLLLVVVVAAVAGDTAGYEIGRRSGNRLVGARACRRYHRHISRGQRLISKRGSFAVFAGRFLPFMRALMPALAGSVRMPYGRFALFNALGNLLWGLGFTLGGYFAGEAFRRMVAQVGQGVAVTAAVAVTIAVVVWVVRRHRGERASGRPETHQDQYRRAASISSTLSPSVASRRSSLNPAAE